MIPWKNSPVKSFSSYSMPHRFPPLPTPSLFISNQKEQVNCTATTLSGVKNVKPSEWDKQEESPADNSICLFFVLIFFSSFCGGSGNTTGMKFLVCNTN